MADILPPSPIDAPFGAYGWVDWYKKVRDAINNAAEIPWTKVTGTPNTIDGYGILDAVKVEGNKLVITEPVSDNSSVFIATLTNSPVAGPPTKWVAFDDNGTIRYQPLW